MTHEVTRYDPDAVEASLNLSGHALHVPGVYFNMPDDEYHADPALGSTSIKRLLEQPFDYWWESPMNELRPEREDTEALIVGRAMHALLLEGEEKFEREYMRGPDNSGKDLAPSDKANRTKAAKKVAAERGQELLKFDAYARIKIAGQMIAKNPDLDGCFANGYSEVSVFWRSHGVPCKARFDYLKVKGIGDLKSITNQMGREFTRACIDQISNYRYDMQAAHYLEGRAQMAQFIADGAVFGDHDAAWLKRVVAFERPAFQWVFVSKTGAPLVWSATISPGNGILDFAHACRMKSLDNYVRYMGEFGPSQLWALITPPMELTMDSMPKWWGLTA